MNLYDAGNNDGLFNLLGGCCGLMDAVDLAGRQHIPAHLATLLGLVENVAGSPVALQQAGADLAGAVATWQNACAGLNARVAAAADDIVRYFVTADSNPADTSLKRCLELVIEAMEAGDYYVTPCVPTATVAAKSGGNAGDAVLLGTVLWDGRAASGPWGDSVREFAHTEAIGVEVLTGTTRPQLRLRGTAAETRPSVKWPTGSDANKTLTATDPAGTLLTNGDFEDAAAADANLPAGWSLIQGTAGSHVILTPVAVREVRVQNSPSGGWWLLTVADPDGSGYTYSTPPLAYNAGGADVQTALRTVPGLEQVTVSTTGSGTNQTHAVSLIGVRGSLGTIAAVSGLTGEEGPTVTIVATVASDPLVYRGRALRIKDVDATVPILVQPVTLTPGEIYFIHARVTREHADTWGTLYIDLAPTPTAAIGAEVEDDEGLDCAIAVDLGQIPPGTFTSVWQAWKPTADACRFPVYVRIYAGPTSTNQSAYVAEVCLVRASAVYAGGPLVAAIGGRTPSSTADSFTLTVANDRSGGRLQTFAQRVFDLARLGLILPHTDGGNLIPDSVCGTIEEEESSSSSSSQSSSSSSSSSSQSSTSSSSTSTVSTSSSSMSSSSSSSSSS